MDSHSLLDSALSATQQNKPSLAAQSESVKKASQQGSAFMAELQARTRAIGAVESLGAIASTPADIKKPDSTVTAPPETNGQTKKWKLREAGATRPNLIVTMAEQAALAKLALVRAGAIQVSLQHKMQVYLAQVTQLNKAIATPDASLAPLDYFKSLLQYRVNRLLLSCHMEVAGYANTITSEHALQLSCHHARAINRLLMYVSAKTPEEFCKLLETIATQLVTKILESPLIKKDSIISREIAELEMRHCYEKFCNTIINNNFVLPPHATTVNYISALTDNLYRGIVGEQKSARERFLAADTSEAETQGWNEITSRDLSGYAAPTPGAAPPPKSRSMCIIS